MQDLKLFFALESRSKVRKFHNRYPKDLKDLYYYVQRKTKCLPNSRQETIP